MTHEQLRELAFQHGHDMTDRERELRVALQDALVLLRRATDEHPLRPALGRLLNENRQYYSDGTAFCLVRLWLDGKSLEASCTWTKSELVEARDYALVIKEKRDATRECVIDAALEALAKDPS